MRMYPRRIDGFKCKPKTKRNKNFQGACSICTFKTCALTVSKQTHSFSGSWGPSTNVTFLTWLSLPYSWLEEIHPFKAGSKRKKNQEGFSLTWIVSHNPPICLYFSSSFHPTNKICCCTSTRLSIYWCIASAKCWRNIFLVSSIFIEVRRDLDWI